MIQIQFFDSEAYVLYQFINFVLKHLIVFLLRQQIEYAYFC